MERAYLAMKNSGRGQYCHRDHPHRRGSDGGSAVHCKRRELVETQKRDHILTAEDVCQSVKGTDRSKVCPLSANIRQNGQERKVCEKGVLCADLKIDKRLVV